MGLKESGLRGSLRNVSVGIDAIPDSGGENQWNWTAGDGTVVVDVNGESDANFNSLSWGTGQGAGDVFGSLNGSEFADLGNEVFTSLLEGGGTLFQWLRTDANDSERRSVFSTQLTSSGDNFGFQIWNDGTNEYRAGIAIDGNFAQPTAGDPNSHRGEWVAYALVYDGESVTTYNSVPATDYSVSEIASEALTATKTGTWDQSVRYGASDDGSGDERRQFNGDLDIGFFKSAALSPSDLQSFVDETKQYYE